jgi:hypothetical protein
MSQLSLISLGSTGITTSVLGFGCSRLIGPLSEQESLGLLDTAYEAGIRHFDVARSYGSGDAERIVGRFLAGRRDQVTVTTKFGMQPLGAVANRRVLLGAARRVMKTSPVARRFLGRQGARLVRRGDFSIERARRSLETSLRALSTDYVDILLLHDCRPEDCSPELLEFLEEAVRAGKVRAFGVGTGIDSARTIAASAPAFGNVLQFQHDVVTPTVQTDEPSSGRALITHGALARLDALRSYLIQHPHVLARWSAELDLDGVQDRRLAALMLLSAARANSRGVVLFGSTRGKNVAANAAAISDSALATRLDPFEALVAKAATELSGA